MLQRNLGESPLKSAGTPNPKFPHTPSSRPRSTPKRAWKTLKLEPSHRTPSQSQSQSQCGNLPAPLPAPNFVSPPPPLTPSRAPPSTTSSPEIATVKTSTFPPSVSAPATSMVPSTNLPEEPVVYEHSAAELAPSLPAPLSEPAAESARPAEPIRAVDLAQPVHSGYVELPTPPPETMTALVDPADTSAAEVALSSMEVVPDLPPPSGPALPPVSAEFENSTSAAPHIHSTPALTSPTPPSAQHGGPSNPPVSAPPVMTSRDVIDLTADSDEEESGPSQRKSTTLCAL